MAVARRLVAEHYQRDRDLILRRWRGGWWGWRTTAWGEIDEALVRSAAYRFTEHAAWIDTSKQVPEQKPWAPTRHKITDLLDALGAICHLPEQVHPPAWLDDSRRTPCRIGIQHPAREIVSVANGLLHVPSRSLGPHDLRFFNNVAVPFAYDPAAGLSSCWLAFLKTLWPDDKDSICTLQEFFGYVISGRTDLHKILLLIGPTRAGKGVIARVLKALVGDGNHAGPTLASLGTNFGLSPLIGKPLAIVADARLGGANVHQVVERLLSISGEDVLTIDRKYRDPWTGTLPTRFLIISNELPRFGDASGAIANRFVILALTKSFLGKENTKLTDELLPELPGILNWSLDGLARLAKRGRFTEPTSSRDAIVALQDLVSPVAAFVRDRCAVGAQHAIECQELYAAWKGWAEETGHRAGSLQTFGRDLRAVVPILRVVRPRDGEGAERPRHYRGLALASPGHNGADRGPSRTNPADPVRDGPRPSALYAGVLSLAAARAWPCVPLRPGLTVIGTEHAWRAFVATAAPTDLQAAEAYLAELREARA